MIMMMISDKHEVVIRPHSIKTSTSKLPSSWTQSQLMKETCKALFSRLLRCMAATNAWAPILPSVYGYDDDVDDDGNEEDDDGGYGEMMIDDYDDVHYWNSKKWWWWCLWWRWCLWQQ